MIKKITGIFFLVIASYLTIYALYKILIKPTHLWLGSKELFSGNFETFTIVTLVFYGVYLFITFLLFKFGIKWTKLFKRTELN